MTVKLDWPPDVVARLQQEAADSGFGLDDYLLQTILAGQSFASVSDASTEATRRKIREDAGRRIRERRTANVLGPDLTVRDLIEEGRRF